MKLKIVNKKKFRSRVLIVAIAFFAIIFNIRNSASSEGIIEYKTISVNSGDTLWSIAEQEQVQNKYYKNSDIRKIVSNLKEVNNLSSCDLTENQCLKIPTVL